MSDTVEKIQQQTVTALSKKIVETIASVERQVVDQIGTFKQLSQESDAVLDRFMTYMNNNFNALLDKEVVNDGAVFSFEELSLVQEEELEVIVALEGMVNHSRNEHLPVFISFNTRLSSLFPRKRIDESSNPLDPDQIATCFQEALRPVGLDAQNTLAVYRAFNKVVLRHLDEILNDANKTLIESGVIPDLGMEGGKGRQPQGRSRPRAADDIGSFGTIEEEAYDEDDEERPELFSIMQNLLHTDEPKPEIPDLEIPDATGTPVAPDQAPTGDQQPGTAPGMVPADSQNMVPADGQQMVPAGQQQFMVPAGMIPTGMVPVSEATAEMVAGMMQPYQPQEGQTVEMVDQMKLMEVLNDIQEKLKNVPHGEIPSSIEDVSRLNISESLGEILQADAEENVVSAVDRQSSDIINLVTLLYEAIWQDPSVPIPIKELIGRTQITIIKVALADVEFFNNEKHPARAILNEFASAGIGWTEVEELEKDPLYLKIQELVERILSDYSDDNELFEDLITDFQTFRAMEAAQTRQLERRILKAKERQDRIDDIHELVNQKIDERILGRDLHPFVDELLKGPFHKFMVMLVLKEGPGGNAWKQAINTIDVLLWSVQPHEQAGDRDRLEVINPRLQNNLRKALRIASVEASEIDELVAQLQQVQRETFHGEAMEEPVTENETADASEPEPIAEPEIVFERADDADEPEAPVQDVAIEAVDEAEVVSIDAAEPELETDEEPELADEELTEDHPAMRQVDNLNVGMWVEFAGEDDNNTRCKLAAKISAIDKLIFVNRQGVKVVEKTKMGLAKEIRDGTVNIISDGLLFSRALESVIGNLRESQHEQQTGSAYQPDQVAS